MLRYQKRHPGKVNAMTAMYYARKIRANTKWANKFFIKEAYHLAELRTRSFGFQWHVDHIVPLKSNIVCGLHCEQNIQVIPGKLNCSKGNRMWSDMPVGFTGGM